MSDFEIKYNNDCLREQIDSIERHPSIELSDQDLVIKIKVIETKTKEKAKPIEKEDGRTNKKNGRGAISKSLI